MKFDFDLNLLVVENADFEVKNDFDLNKYIVEERVLDLNRDVVLLMLRIFLPNFHWT